MNTLEYEAALFAATYPTPASHPYGGDGSWDQDCGRACNRLNEWLGYDVWPQHDISSAYRIAKASGPLNRDAAAAGRALADGWLIWHYWDIGGPDNGHVATQIDLNTLVFMGSAGVWEDVGVDIGFSSVAGYNAYRPGAVYLGWSTSYAGGRVNVSRFVTPRPGQTAGLGTVPLPGTPITEGNLSMGDRQYFARIKPNGEDDGDWTLTGRDIEPEPVDRFAETGIRYFEGFAATKDKAVAKRWARAYGIGPTETRAVRLERADYEAQQDFARDDAQRHRAYLRGIIDASLYGPTGGQVSA